MAIPCYHDNYILLEKEGVSEKKPTKILRQCSVNGTRFVHTIPFQKVHHFNNGFEKKAKSLKIVDIFFVLFCYRKRKQVYLLKM